MTPLFLLVLCLIQKNIYAQNTGTLSGFVTDAQTGEPLPGATVKLEGTNRGAAIDTTGFFAIEDIPPKSYTIAVSFVGYQPETRYNVEVNSGRNPDLNFALQPSVSKLEEITVAPDPYEQPPENPLSRQTLSRVQIASYPGGNSDIAKSSTVVTRRIWLSGRLSQ